MGAIISLLNIIISVLQIIIIAGALLSFFPQLSFHSNPDVRRAVRFIRDINEPILAPVRQLLPPFNGLDFSPLVVLILLSLFRDLILR